MSLAEQVLTEDERALLDGLSYPVDFAQAARLGQFDIVDLVALTATGIVPISSAGYEREGMARLLAFQYKGADQLQLMARFQERIVKDGFEAPLEAVIDGVLNGTAEKQIALLRAVGTLLYVTADDFAPTRAPWLRCASDMFAAARRIEEERVT